MPDQKKVKLLYDALVWQVEKHAVELNQPEDQELWEVWNGKTIERISLISKKKLKDGVCTIKMEQQ
ncbi:hypothetical protein D3C72_2458260 [compost metagenome]